MRHRCKRWRSSCWRSTRRGLRPISSSILRPRYGGKRSTSRGSSERHFRPVFPNAVAGSFPAKSSALTFDVFLTILGWGFLLSLRSSCRELPGTSLGIQLTENREACFLLLGSGFPVPLLSRSVFLKGGQAIVILLPWVRFWLGPADKPGARVHSCDAAAFYWSNGASTAFWSYGLRVARTARRFCIIAKEA